MNLVIVESPAKAKTIEGYLGKDFKVKSSYGHVRDLGKKGLSIDIENGFEPNYEVIPDKKKTIKELKDLSKKADTVWLATDEDREGEAISWHLFKVLDLPPEKTKRIVFHEITKSAIEEAIKNPRQIDEALVKAQQARRVLDRLVGFELSPILWKKVKPSLSAGRVQSVTVRLIVERENEIRNFVPESFFRVSAVFTLQDGTLLKAQVSEKFKTEEDAKAFMEACAENTFTIESVEKKPVKKSPPPPFTTSSLQQEASRKLGFSVNQTMVIAQRLYESGKITYMRTDSVNLSNLALATAKEEIISRYGKEYSKPRKFATKSKGAQEAHEAIRPTYINKVEIDGDRNEKKLYKLIWNRTVASQMSEALLEKTTVKIAPGNLKQRFVAQGEVIKFDGFLKVYQVSTEDSDEENGSALLPEMKVGEQPVLKELEATQRFTQHPPRYSEATLVRKLEELGIGRPSTYAPTISTIQKRGYVQKKSTPGKKRKAVRLVLDNGKVRKEIKEEVYGKEKNKLFPTDIGEVVTNFLIEHFDDILDYNFTARVEEEFDEIARGQIEWNSMIDNFYGAFHKGVEETLENSEKATGSRLLGKDPETGKPVYARIGRFGPMVQIGDAEDEEKPKFASLLPHQSITDITLEDALTLFKLPRNLGEYNGESVMVGIGKYGPYIRQKNMFVSIDTKTGDDPYTITLERAIQLIEQHKQTQKNNIIKEFDEDKTLKVLNGRYGPYIKKGRKNYKIPKGTDPASLTLDQCNEIIEKQSVRKAKK